MKSEWVAVFDVDGVLTDGTFYSTKDGKFIKRFGPDDWDAMRELQSLCTIQVVTADKKGYSIVEKRIADEMKFPLELVENKPPTRRWQWIKKRYPDKKIIYVGDGLYDWYCLAEADWSAAPADALSHVRQRANYVSSRKGSNRFVADVCLHVLDEIFKVDTWTIGMADDNK